MGGGEKRTKDRAESATRIYGVCGRENKILGESRRLGRSYPAPSAKLRRLKTMLWSKLLCFEWQCTSLLMGIICILEESSARNNNKAKYHPQLRLPTSSLCRQKFSSSLPAMHNNAVETLDRRDSTRAAIVDFQCLRLTHPRFYALIPAPSHFNFPGIEMHYNLLKTSDSWNDRCGPAWDVTDIDP